jgi:hypothetical protein
MRASLVVARSRKVAMSGTRPTNQNSAETVKYVLTAKTSNSSGLRKFGHICMVFGYGNSQYISQGRPRWNTGYMPAQATAKSVIASAKRLMDVRQSCRSSSSTAEMRVPACPMPIHQTKLTMSKPQPTGWLTPQRPMPRITRLPMDQRKTISSAKDTAKPMSQILFGFLVRTMAAMESVTVPRVWPGSITGARSDGGPIDPGSLAYAGGTSDPDPLGAEGGAVEPGSLGALGASGLLGGVLGGSAISRRSPGSGCAARRDRWCAGWC